MFAANNKSQAIPMCSQIKTRIHKQCDLTYSNAYYRDYVEVGIKTSKYRPTKSFDLIPFIESMFDVTSNWFRVPV